ncbi:MAG: hypothetical protein WBO44_08470 [Saprospiraceae bacterium]
MKQINIFFDSGNTTQVQGSFIDTVSSINDFEYRFIILDSFNLIPNERGYFFAYVDESGGIYRVFRKLPLNATLAQFQKVITDIIGDRYSFQSDNIDDIFGGTGDATLFKLPIGDKRYGGGVIPFDILPKWIKDIMHSIGLDGLSLPWWAFMALGGYSAYKLSDKKSNTLLYGALLLIGLAGTLKALNNKSST